MKYLLPRSRLLRRFRRRRIERPLPVVSRRRLVLQAGLGLGAGLLLLARLWRTRRRPSRPRATEPPVRPPTASADDRAFRGACIRCGLCGSVCENGCIRYFGLDEPSWGPLTPYLDVRERSCTLCMRCTEICPTGALEPVEAELGVIAERVRMGTAVVDPDRCISYLGRICGYCHDACPLPNHAIKLVPKAKPVVLAQGCVGCGRCVEYCPQSPTAIDVWRRA